MQPWQSGKCLLTDFDLKIGKLSFSIRKKTINQQDIDRACIAADTAISRIIQRQDHESKNRQGRRRTPNPRSR
ncbi:hypothetical protein BS639_16980 [Rouxiella silvae]|uniref:Uncharacterized protein n=1 Tax=Rouxiella silvae TaxID=1646373 RepID=A0ABX3TXR7_9GAMM|nr:hypothetical protein BS639_16980 [Rouxiella silvae]